jgi:parallel beta-helix repeat protein
MDKKSVVLALCILTLLTASSETIDYDKNLKVYSFSGVTITAPYVLTCRWSDPKSSWKQCEAVIEINNTNPIAIPFKSSDILSNLNVSMLYSGKNFLFEFSNTSKPVIAEALNTTCAKNLNLTNRTVREMLDNKSICYYNYTKNEYYDWMDIKNFSKIPKGAVAVKISFDTPIITSKGAYQKNHFNFTIAGQAVSYTLDPEISTCATLDSAGATYTLTADIIDSSASTCMDITANNIILDCQGHTIDGVDTGGTYGINIIRASQTNTNITIKNCVVTDWDEGLYLEYSSNNTFTNITTNSNTCGLDLYRSSNNIFTNITANSNGYEGFYLYSSSNNTFTNITADSNSEGFYLESSSNNNTFTNIIATNNDKGFYLYGSSNNIFTNITANSNTDYGFHLALSSNNSFTNITANSNGYGFYLYSSSNNTFTNVTANSNGYGFYLYSSSNNNIFTNITTNSNTWVGLYLEESSNNNILTNITTNLNGYQGFYFDTSSNNILTNCIVNSNGYEGFYLYSASNNTFTNIIATNNDKGFYLYGSSNNTIRNSIISNSSTYGIHLEYSTASGEYAENNTFYNNLLNNTDNFLQCNWNHVFCDTPSGTNYWNTTNQTGTRIFGAGTNIGGNYYTNSSGNGYSDTCTDADGDGFCDTPYTLAENNIDYLPLSNKYPENNGDVVIWNSPANNSWNVNPEVTHNYTPISRISAFINCSLYTNDTGALHFATANTTPIENNTPNYIAYTYTTKGSPILAYIECCNTTSCTTTDNYTVKILQPTPQNSSGGSTPQIPPSSNTTQSPLSTIQTSKNLTGITDFIKQSLKFENTEIPNVLIILFVLSVVGFTYISTKRGQILDAVTYTILILILLSLLVYIGVIK